MSCWTVWCLCAVADRLGMLVYAWAQLDANPLCMRSQQGSVGPKGPPGQERDGCWAQSHSVLLRIRSPRQPDQTRKMSSPDTIQLSPDDSPQRGEGELTVAETWTAVSTAGCTPALTPAVDVPPAFGATTASLSLRLGWSHPAFDWEAATVFSSSCLPLLPGDSVTAAGDRTLGTSGMDGEARCLPAGC